MKLDLSKLVSGESAKAPVESDADRPVKWVAEGKNVWRIVYAD